MLLACGMCAYTAGAITTSHKINGKTWMLSTLCLFKMILIKHDWLLEKAVFVIPSIMESINSNL